LAILQYPDAYGVDSVPVLVTKIKFQQEEEESRTFIHLDKLSDMQAFGKACSYITRYVYKMMLGIEAADEDDDGNESAGITHNSAPSDTISDKQLWLLKSTLKDQPNREPALLLHYKIDTLAKLPKKYMDEVLTALKPKE
jgi:hypothetical protein